MIKHLNKELRPLCEADFPGRGPHLFGVKFAAIAKSTADCLKHVRTTVIFSGMAAQAKGNSPWAASKNTAKNSIFYRLGNKGMENQKGDRSWKAKKQCTA